MSESIYCSCCHHEIDMESLPVCNYCGFLNIAVVGNTDISDNETLSYRRGLLSAVTDISMEVYEYGWNDSAKKYEQLSVKVIKIADGIQCDSKVVWSSQEFGQWWDENENVIPLKISFSAYGKNWSYTHKR